MNSGVSKCRPLWEILKGMRLLLCNHILGPLVRSHDNKYRNYEIFYIFFIRRFFTVLHFIFFFVLFSFLVFQNGFWFATLIGALIMIVSTPIAHILSLVYRRPSFSKKDTSLLSMRSLVLLRYILSSRNCFYAQPTQLLFVVS